MDNRQIHVPFFSPAMAGRPVDTASYQYHHLAFGIEQDREDEYVHGQITTLRAAAVHPIIQSLPLDLRAATRVFRSMRVGLGIANVNFHDRRRPDSTVTVRPIEGTDQSELVISYVDDPGEAARSAAAIRVVKRALRALGGFVPPGMTRTLPKGASVHYTGTLPVSAAAEPLTCTRDCRSRDFENLSIVDGASFPFLPAKNLTLTLMANAVRVAETIA